MFHRQFEPPAQQLKGSDLINFVLNEEIHMFLIESLMLDESIANLIKY